MASIPKKRSLAIMQHPDAHTPQEFDSTEYGKEVLLLDGTSEEALDEALARQAATLGITMTQTAAATVEGHNSLRDSVPTVVSGHARTSSTGSETSMSTSLTSRSSREHFVIGVPSIVRQAGGAKRALSFADYERFLAQISPPSQLTTSSATPPETAPSLFSVSTRKSYNSVRSNLISRLRLRRNKAASGDLCPCVCCQDEYKINKGLHTLPCLHNYCDKCLRVLIMQAASEESIMPPRCCGKPMPSVVIKSVLNRDEQVLFMKSVIQFSTPWEERVFCPNSACGEFIPKTTKIDPKYPFQVVCKRCGTRACSTCKQAAHCLGQDCPSDKELEAVLLMGESLGWKRCYKCRTMVELTQGCSHITCRCKAEWCYICSAVYSDVGCPNYCNGEEELERRRLQEELRAAEQAAEKAAQEAAESARTAAALEAVQRSEESEELNTLRTSQLNERDRFIAFQRKMKWLLWTRHGQMKLDLLDRYADLQSKMKERHVKTATHLEDRQVGAEMELRVTLKQSERSVHIRLRHMEAYCDGLGRASSGTNPARVVTERDLRELGQQYSLRDDIERIHQSRINVMREKQGRQMEQLLSRQEEELEKFALKQADELDALEEAFVCEEEEFTELFKERRLKIRRRWALAEEVTRKQMETRDGVVYAELPPVDWPDPEKKDDVLEAVSE